jgi:adenine/guanine phosphoribosyltransferase-like PRPP-binding protein
MKIDIIEAPRTPLPYPVYTTTRKEPVEFLINHIVNWVNKVDMPVFIWCRGSSGMYLATMVTARTSNPNVHISFIRKADDVAHCAWPYLHTEASAYSSTDTEVCNIIVDDFIVSGHTLKSILNIMQSSIFTVDYIFTGTEVSSKPALQSVAATSSVTITGACLFDYQQ